MRIRKITWRNRSYMARRWLLRDPNLPRDYESLRKFVFADFMGTSDAWEDGFTRLGLDARDLPIGIRELEEAWWTENGGASKLPDSETVTAAQLRQEAPDVLIVEGLEHYQPSDLDKLRIWLPKLKLLVGTSGNEINDSDIFRPLDLFLSNRPTLVDLAKNAGRSAYRVPHGFDDRILPLIGNVAKTRDCVFAGLIHSGERYHDRRRAILEKVVRQVDAQIFSDSALSLRKAFPEFVIKATAWSVAKVAGSMGVPLGKLPGGRQLQIAQSWSRPPALNWSPALARALHPAVYGLDMFNVLASSRVTMNVQPGNADRAATNMRMFEATGAGACLVTDAADDLKDFFAEDEVVVFQSEDEAAEKVKYLVNNPMNTQSIAEKARRRVDTEHTYFHRMNLVHEILTGAIKLK